MVTVDNIELACGDSKRQAPFERITRNTSEFVHADYLPNSVSLKDPRSMNIIPLTAFFKYVAAREDSHGVSNAFRFKSVLSSRKKGHMLPAHYQIDNTAEGEEPRISRRRRNPQGQVDHSQSVLSNQASNTDDVPAPTDSQSRHGDHGQSVLNDQAANADEVPAPTESRARHGNNGLSVGVGQYGQQLTQNTGLYTPEKTPEADRNLTTTPINNRRQGRNRQV